jgi:uncharacterized cupin superfamily protein
MNEAAEDRDFPAAIRAGDAPPRAATSNYPEPFASRMSGRDKRPLGDLFGLTRFGVNLTRLAPGAMSALKHAHALQDEFVYVLEGRPTLHLGDRRIELAPGHCAGFRHGTGIAHHLVNESESDAVYLEIGDRTPGESATYPDDDLTLVSEDGVSRFLHKDGTPY